jgi:anti-sigma factor RsiW
MSCEKMESRILGFVDGRLKETERLETEKHLATCSACALRVNEFRAVNSLLEELPLIEPSGAFDARVRALVAAEPEKQNSWWAWLTVSPRIAFAASVLAIAMVWMGIASRQQPGQPPINMAQADAEMMQDLPVLEDHDVLTNFEPLKELPPPAQSDDDDDTTPQHM